MFISNITFETDPVAELIGSVDRILEAERIAIKREREAHCCYCDPQACSPVLKIRMCDACMQVYEQ